MRFNELAIICERLRLGEKTPSLSLNYRNANIVYNILFPNETLTDRELLSKVAKELCVPYEVLLTLEAKSTSDLLASESSASNPTEWTLNDALRVRDATVSSAFSYLSLSKQMDCIDARLFWDSVLGKRMPLSSLAFLKALKPDVSPETISNSRAFLTDYEIISALYDNQDALLDPKRWYEKPTAALRKRKWKPWSKYVTTNLDTFQAIPTGTVVVEYNEEENVIIERVGSTITDVAYPAFPNLPLRERLIRYADTHEDAVIAWPEMIPSWESIVKRDGTIRFPDTGPFSPSEYGGFVLVKQSHISNLRLGSYKYDDGLHVRLEALDGDEYIEIGTCSLHIPPQHAQISFTIERMVGTNTQEARTWVDIPEDICIVLGVSSPFVDRRTGMLSDPTIIDVRDDKGISDITQYVDLVGVYADR